MKKILCMVICLMYILTWGGCSKKEPSIVATYEITKAELVEEYFNTNQFVIRVKYYEMSDDSWKTDEYTYKYRLEIEGTMPNSVKNSTFVYLSNEENITFTKAWKASGLSSNTMDYFQKEVAILVAIK